MTTTKSWDDFKEWYSISGSIYTDGPSAWYIWQTIKAYEDSKDKEQTSE